MMMCTGHTQLNGQPRHAGLNTIKSRLAGPCRFGHRRPVLSLSSPLCRTRATVVASLNKDHAAPLLTNKSRFTAEATRLLELSNSMRELGVENVIDVPTLVIAGNQSSGKSSVVENVTGVPLPRASGTCTRCPTELRLCRSPATTCTIVEKITTDAADAASGFSATIKLKRMAELGSDSPATEELLCTVYDKPHATEAILTAQALLLNPAAVQSSGLSACRFWDAARMEPSAEFGELLEGKSAEAWEEEFTRSCVVVEVAGADVDLTIVDLPGIIQSHPKDARYVDLVKSMVHEVLARPNTVIVMALSAMDDLENQAVNQLARNVDPDGMRTLAVITKPDNIPVGDHQKWAETAANVNPRRRLQHGYYVVRNRNQKELEAGLSMDDARKAEAEFFRRLLDQEPEWGRRKADLHSHLGTPALQDSLTSLLVTALKVQLPEIRKKASLELARVSKELESLPPALRGDPLFELQRSLTTVVQTLNDRVRAEGSASRSLHQRLDGHFRTFHNNIAGSLPVFCVEGAIVDCPPLHDEDMTAAAAGSVSFPVRVTFMGDTDSSAPDDDDDAPDPAVIASAVKLAEVTDILRSSRGRELPSFFPYTALERLLEKFRGRWHEYAQEVAAAAVQALREELARVVAEEFKRFPAAKDAVMTQACVLLDEHAEALQERVEQWLDMEDTDVHTLLKADYIAAESAYLAALKKSYLGEPPAKLNANDQASLLGQLRKLGHDFRSMDQLFLSQTTPVEAELKMMSAAMAYFQVSHKRVVDSISMHIRSQLRSATDPREMPLVLKERMLPDGASMEQDARTYLEEDARLALRREELHAMKHRLSEAVRRLMAAPSAM